MTLNKILSELSKFEEETRYEPLNLQDKLVVSKIYGTCITILGKLNNKSKDIVSC